MPIFAVQTGAKLWYTGNTMAKENKTVDHATDVQLLKGARAEALPVVISLPQTDVMRKKVSFEILRTIASQILAAGAAQGYSSESALVTEAVEVACYIGGWLPTEFYTELNVWMGALAEKQIGPDSSKTMN